ncbi:hypothetical protein AB2B41_18875 [Marimonas sp. MJW-29]|uniref:Signal transduction histidine kinase dimerisation/phosphoacceptor domain-containing protein n=1 Tax=Sulfitobacter sediminis TaxID=3234186 RepID=A0ABV3RT01_9RHOB
MPGRPAGEQRTLYTRHNGIVIAAARAVAGFVIFGELDEGFDTSFAVRSLFMLVVLLFAFFLVQSVIGILRARDASQRNALDIARRETAQARALLEAEKKYARAKEAARLHTLRFANALHDIRQPITSLRATIAAVARDQSVDDKTQLKSASTTSTSLPAVTWKPRRRPTPAPESPKRSRPFRQQCFAARSTGCSGRRSRRKV